MEWLLFAIVIAQGFLIGYYHGQFKNLQQTVDILHNDVANMWKKAWEKK